jgi:hypothetical protein
MLHIITLVCWGEAWLCYKSYIAAVCVSPLNANNSWGLCAIVVVFVNFVCSHHVFLRSQFVFFFVLLGDSTFCLEQRTLCSSTMSHTQNNRVLLRVIAAVTTVSLL